jgi:hypothetical protein
LNKSLLESLPLKASGVIPSGMMPLDLTTNTKRLGIEIEFPAAWISI